jgi:hypothetical protein
MSLGKFVKSPVERKRYEIDYSEWLDTGETVSTIVFTPTPAGQLIIDAYSISSSGTSVVFFVNYGNAGISYTVDVLINTSGGQTKEDTIIYSVRNV